MHQRGRAWIMNKKKNVKCLHKSHIEKMQKIRAKFGIYFDFFSNFFRIFWIVFNFVSVQSKELIWKRLVSWYNSFIHHSCHFTLMHTYFLFILEEKSSANTQPNHPTKKNNINTLEWKEKSGRGEMELNFPPKIHWHIWSRRQKNYWHRIIFWK